MKDQFDQLESPESLREECRSLLTQLKATQESCRNARLDELGMLYNKMLADGMLWFVPIQPSELADYILQRKDEIKQL